MKKTGTLNANLSKAIAQMGHTDRLVICDSGLPIPRDGNVIDLALTKNIPSFMQTVKVILQELEVESVVIAREMEKINKTRYEELMKELRNAGINEVKKVPHEEFKKIIMSGNNIVFVRTGEATPYANIILVAGVAFD
jgi:D-ribose pyranase